MKGKYQIYPEYKTSGFKWLGNVPNHWGVSPIKRQIERVDGGAWGQDPDGVEDTIVLRSTEQTADGQWNIQDPAPRKLSMHEITATLLKNDDLLMTKSSGSSLHIGKTTIVTEEIARLRCGYSNFMQRIRIKRKCSAKFYWYIFNNELARKQLDYLSNSTTGLANLNSTMIGEIIGATPPKGEQEKIVNFLDHEISKIDTLIEKQQQLIKLLKEKRQAVISHAVTKGLNPNAAMCDSGVEWLGKVPVHWDVKKFKYLCDRIIAGPFGSSITKDMYVKQGYKVYGQEQVIPNNFEIGDYYINEKNYLELSRYIVGEGDVLISCVGTFGKIAVFPKDAKPGIINPRLIKAEISSHHNAHYIREMLKSEMVFKQFELLSRGGTMGVINIAILSEILAAVPPENEQREVVNYINQQKEKFSILIGQANKAVQLLQERRMALISSAVTGKIDVRNWKAPEPLNTANNNNKEVAA